MKTLYLFLFCCLFSSLFSQQLELVVPKGHNEPIDKSIFSPDGKYLLSRSKNEIILWDANLARQIRKFNTNENNIEELQFHPEGNLFVTLQKEYKSTYVLVWDLTKPEHIRKIEICKDQKKVYFSPDGKYLIVNAIMDIFLYDFKSGILEKKISFFDYNTAITASVISHDNQKLIVGLYNDKIITWDIASAKTLNTFEGHDIKIGTFHGISSIKQMQDSNYVFSISATNYEQVLCILWEINTGKIIWQSYFNDVGRLFYSKDNSLTIMRKNNFYSYLLDNKTGKIVDSISKQAYIELHPNNQQFATDDCRDIMIVDLKTKNTIKRLKGSSLSLANVWLTELKQLYATSIYDQVAYKSDFIGKLPLKSQNEQYRKYFPTKIDNTFLTKKILSDDEGIINSLTFAIYNQFQNKTIAEYKTQFNSNVELRAIATINGSIKYILLYDFSKSLQNSKEFYQLYNLDNDQIQEEYSYTKIHGFDPLPLFKFTLDGQYIVSANYEYRGQLHLWKTSSFKPIKQINENYQKFGEISSIEFSNDEKYLISATKDKHLSIFSFQKGQIELVKDFDDFEFPVDLIKISDNNKYLFAASGNDVLVYDLVSLNPIARLKGHTASISDIKYIDAFNLFLSTSTDNTTRFWNLNGKQLAALIYLDLPKEDNSNDFVILTPDGFFDGTDDAIKKLHFVDGLSILPLNALFEKYYTPGLINYILNNQSIELVNRNFNKALSDTISSLAFLSPPPIIEIISPQNQSVSDKQTIEIEVKVEDSKDNLNEILIYHNGKLLDGTARGFKSTRQNHEFTISLVDGENRIKATAFNSQRTEAIPDEIVVHYKAPQQVKPNMHILAIGINNYLNPKYSLNYAKNDADAFAQTLKTGASSIFGNVNLTVINDADATKAGILAAIEKIKSASKAEDVFVFYYAGHGVMSSGNGIEKPQFFLVPHDVTKMYEADEMLKKLGISATEIGEFSKNIKAQKQLFVIDACQSGGAVQTLAMRGAAEEKAIAQLARSTGTYFIAASGTEQFATEVAELGHGIFTYSVIEALNGSCKSSDGKVTVNLLKSCVEDLVPELSKKHKGQPQFPTGYGFGMDFPIVIVK